MNPLAHGVLVGARVKDGQAVQVQIRKGAAHAGRDPGASVRLTSKPWRRCPRTMRRSSSAPSCVRQKKHSSRRARKCRMISRITNPSTTPQPGMHVKRASVRDAEQGMEQPRVCDVDLGRLHLALAQIFVNGASTRTTKAEARTSR